MMMWQERNAAGPLRGRQNIIYQRFVSITLSSSLPRLKQLEVFQACLRFLVNKNL